MRAIVTRLGVLLACIIAGTSITGVARADAAAPHHTRQVVVRPVTTTGQPAHGWTVRHVRGRASCDEASPSAKADAIATCSPSALYLPSCWQQVAEPGVKSTPPMMLCLRDPAGHQLVQVRLDGAFPTVTAPQRPAPQALLLGDGESCQIRVGGAWGTVPKHRRWVGFYSCDGGDVYGPPRSGGIDRSRATWRVRLLESDGTVVTRNVRKATYVGTAVVASPEARARVAG
jgi:hypothetical protein